jgi:hypothetical protein
MMLRCLIVACLVGASCASADPATLEAPPPDAPIDAATDTAPIDAATDTAPIDAATDTALIDAATDSAPDAPRTAPTRATRWHIDLEAPVDVTVDVDWFDVDLFDTDRSVVAALHARGRRVVCYFSAGSGEDWRPDYRAIASAALGSALDGWPGERWLDVRAASVRTVMRQRLDRAVANGCDGVDPDNVDGYTQQSGFPLRAADQLAYNRFLAAEAHARGLVVGLKNDLDQAATLAADFDFAINEQCFTYNECAALAPFTRAGKSVLQIEYGTVATLAPRVCPAAAALGLFSVLPGADRLAGAYRRCSDGRDVR